MSTGSTAVVCLMAIMFIGSCESRKSYSKEKDPPSPQPALPSYTYDQRQTGKYNINLNIKDVAIISIDPESLASNIGDSADAYEDYYDYDISDFTISPIAALLGGTPPKKTTTEAPNSSTEASSSASSTLNSNDTSVSGGETKPASPTKTTSKPPNVIIVSSTPSPDDFLANHIAAMKENQIPVHILMDHSSVRNAAVAPVLLPISVNPSEMAQSDEHKSVVVPNYQRAHFAKPAGHADRVKRIRTRAVSGATGNRRCAHGQGRDESGRCQSVNRRKGLRNVMNLLTMLAPKDTK